MEGKRVKDGIVKRVKDGIVSNGRTIADLSIGCWWNGRISDFRAIFFHCSNSLSRLRLFLVI